MSEITPEIRQGIIKRFIQIGITVLMMGLVLFIASGDLSWGWAWLYLLAYVLGVVINASILLRRDPGLVAERGQPKEGVKDWDRKLTRITVPLWLLIFLIAGLDRRFGWTPALPVWIHISGLVLYAIGNAIVLWALNTNTFFSTSVRIQDDRGHEVVKDGPYAIIRHPGYSGMILHMTGIPLLLGSIWALLPALLVNVAAVIRTRLEDQTLQEELPGYREYTSEVQFRLAPGLW